MSLTILRDGTPALDESGLPWRIDNLASAKAYVACHVGWSIGRLPLSDPRLRLPCPPFGREEWPFIEHADGSVTIDVCGWRYTILDERAEWCHENPED